jgi:hypothetical protein
LTKVLDKPPRARDLKLRKVPDPKVKVVRVRRKPNRPWEPLRQTVEVSPGVFREQTKEEAMEDARALVRHYVAIGYPAAHICRLMKPLCEEPTLHKHFKDELEVGKLSQDARVAAVAYRMASSGRDPHMTRWWIDRRFKGWKLNAEDGMGDRPPIRIEMMPGDEGL